MPGRRLPPSTGGGRSAVPPPAAGRWPRCTASARWWWQTALASFPLAAPRSGRLVGASMMHQRCRRAYPLMRRRHASEAQVDEQRGTVKFHVEVGVVGVLALDRKSTRLNSSHVEISYAVFCLKK